MVNRAPILRLRSSKVTLTCQRVTALIQDYLSGQLNPETALAFRKHLRNCPDCLAFLNTYKKTISAIRSLRYEQVPSALRGRARRFLQGRIEGFPQRG